MTFPLGNSIGFSPSVESAFRANRFILLCAIEMKWNEGRTDGRFSSSPPLIVVDGPTKVEDAPTAANSGFWRLRNGDGRWTPPPPPDLYL